jgi:hypothetical protein
VITIKSLKDNPDLIALWYLTLLGSGRASKVFQEFSGNLKSVIQWAEEIDYIKGAFLDDTFIGVGFVEEVKRLYLNDGVYSKARIGFGFMPNCNVFQALRAGKMIVTDAFDELKLDHMFGFTPEENQQALAYIRRVGFNLYGPIPQFTTYNGNCMGSYVSHMTRKEWTEKNH